MSQHEQSYGGAEADVAEAEALEALQGFITKGATRDQRLNRLVAFYVVTRSVLLKNGLDATAFPGMDTRAQALAERLVAEAPTPDPHAN